MEIKPHEEQKCPQCGYWERLVINSEELPCPRLMCPICGCSRDVRLLENGEGNIDPEYHSEDEKGYGVAVIAYKSGEFGFRVFESPASDQDLRELKDLIMGDENVDPYRSYIEIWEEHLGETWRAFVGGAKPWETARPIERWESKWKLHYDSTCSGITQYRTGGEMLYYGGKLTIPQNQIGNVEWLHYNDPGPDSVVESISGIVGDFYEPVPDAVIERIETMMPGTGDILVVYRAPFRFKPGVKNEKPSKSTTYKCAAATGMEPSYSKQN